MYHFQEVQNKVKKPKASELEYGELAINYNADHEFLSVKNSKGKVITFFK